MIEFSQTSYVLTLDSAAPVQFSRGTPVQVTLSDDTFTSADDLSLNFIPADGRSHTPARVPLTASGTEGVYTGVIGKSALLRHGLILVALGGIVTSTGQVITSAAARVPVYQSVDPEAVEMPDDESLVRLISAAVDDYAGEHGITTGATAAEAAQIEKNAQDIAVLGATEPVDINDINLWEQGHIKTSDGTYGTSDAASYAVQIRTVGYISNAVASARATGGNIRVFRYSTGGTFIDYFGWQTSYNFDHDTYKYRIALTDDATASIDVSFYTHAALFSRYNDKLADALTRVKTVNGISPDSSGNVSISASGDSQQPLVQFDIDHNMRDVSAELAQMDYSNGANQTDVLEQVYELFDDLVTAHPEYVTKSDAAQLCSMSYPTYANGVTSSGTYDITPAYKTYLYSFSESNTYAGNGGTCKKRKLLIVSGLHGNEIAAPFNCYLFAKQLCSGVLNDPNFFKLRAAFDVYILPCLNGYGMYHNLRTNANGVNINRNFPIKNWTISGADTDDYTGATAGSEFETQLVTGLIDYINPDIVIDHHNYSRLQRQFYTSLCDIAWLPLAYQSLADCSIAFKKQYPDYFGTGYGLLLDSAGSAPGTIASADTGTCNRWLHEHGVPFTSTVEVSEVINYINGTYSGERNDEFGADTFSVAEYTLRNLLLHYCQYVLGG